MATKVLMLRLQTVKELDSSSQENDPSGWASFAD